MQKTRDAVKAVYPSRKWAAKIDAMGDDQVVAIYMRLKLQGVIR